MKKFIGMMMPALLVLGSGFVQAGDQAKLDAACEQAREKKLAPLRVGKVKECIAAGKMDKQKCSSEYANYDGRVGNKQLPFYDLPECVKAHDNKKGSKR